MQAQQKMRETLERWIPKILAAQKPDGYLQTAYTLADRQGAGRSAGRQTPRQPRRLRVRLFHRVGHQSLHADQRQGQTALQRRQEAGGLLGRNLGPGKKEWYDGHEEMEQALVRFGRFVNDMKVIGRGDAYIALAKFLLDSPARGGSEYDQSHVPPGQQYEAVGHAVRALFLLRHGGHRGRDA